ncbi:MAG: hypothetical protein ACYTE8_00385 [Planctomycetota bacterium]
MPIKTWDEFKEDFKKLVEDGAIARRGGLKKWLKDWTNLVDDPIDWVKEKVHGAHLPFGYEINISCLMANRDTTWNIIRKQGNYPNSDPEDLEG